MTPGMTGERISSWLVEMMYVRCHRKQKRLQCGLKEPLMRMPDAGLEG